MTFIQTPNFSNASSYTIASATVNGYSNYALATATSAMAVGNVTAAINSASSEL